MNVVKQEYKQRKEDIENYYLILEKIVKYENVLYDNNTKSSYKINIDSSVILKSSFYLLLYNCVESTVTNCLTAICKAINNESIKYNDLSEEIKYKVVDAIDFGLSSSKIIDSRQEKLKFLQRSFETMNKMQNINFNLSELVHSSSQGTYSGSLDTREIKKIFGSFGINLTSKFTE